MLGVRPNSDITTTSVLSSMPRSARSAIKRGKRAIELAELLEVEVEVLVVRVVVGVRHLHEA